MFISYAREDRGKIGLLRDALERRGLDIWVDERLVAGDHYDVAIEQALAEADRVIVAWSPTAAASQWVRAEAGEGLERGVLVPVLISATRIPLEFRRIQAVDLTGWNGSPDAVELEGLLAALQGRPRAKTKPSEPIKLTRPAGASEPISAEVLGASKYVFNVRIRVQIGEKSFSVRHVNRLIYQVVKVDGRVVSRGSFGFLHDHHRFSLTVGDKDYPADLFLSGDPTSGISQIAMNVQGREIVRQKIGWIDGLVGLFGVMFMAAAAAFFWSEMFGPSALSVFGLTVFGLLLALAWAAV